MRHRNAGFKLGSNTSHRRAMLRNLVTSVILMDRVETTITKCKATSPLIEKMITLGKRGTVHARRQAAAYLMTPESVDRLFATVAPRYSDRQGGYLRITRTGARKGDAAEMAFIELLGAEKSSTRRPRSAPKPAPRSAKSSPSRWKSKTPAKAMTPTPSHRSQSHTHRKSTKEARRKPCPLYLHAVILAQRNPLACV